MAAVGTSVAFSSDINCSFTSSMEKCITALLAPVSADVGALQNQLQNLTLFVQQMSAQLTLLKAQISPTSSVIETNNQPQQTAERQSISSATDELQSRHSMPSRDIRHDAVTEMYIDLNRKQRRASNIVINGLPPTNSTEADANDVYDLLLKEFDYDWALNIVSCRRLGQVQPGKIQPLLVTFDSPEPAEYYIKRAKWLRSSHNPSVSNNIFINADYTPSEAKAAFELRQRRRQRGVQRGRRVEESHAHTQNQSTAGSGQRDRVFFQSRQSRRVSAADEMSRHHTAPMDQSTLGPTTLPSTATNVSNSTLPEDAQQSSSQSTAPPTAGNQGRPC